MDAIESDLYSESMSNDVQNRISSVLGSDGGPISMYFYGGEPLLEVGIVENMLRVCRDSSEKRGINIRSTLITNGYLLTKKISQELSSLGLNHIQITIDGSENTHNKRRMLIGGKPTYSRIVENTKIAKPHPKRVS